MNDPAHRRLLGLCTELFSIALDRDQFLIYAPLVRVAFVANAELVNALADVEAGGQPSDPGLPAFLNNLGLTGERCESLHCRQLIGQPSPTAVTLFLTTACNLRCTYCYASAGDAPTRAMTLDVAKRGIDYVAGNAHRTAQRRFELAYHGGGEPSVNWRVMVDSLDYARGVASRYGLEVAAATATNGMLSDTQIDWMISNLDGLTVSFDGLPSAQDRHRMTADGRGSSKRVEHALHRFDAARMNYGIRVTVTEDQIPLLEAGVDHICRHFSPSRIQVEPAYQLGRGCGAPSAETKDFITAFRAAQVRALMFGREINFSAARLGTLTNHFCGVSQDTFCLSPDGNVSACYEVFSESNPWAKMFFYGKAATAGGGYEFDTQRLDHLRGLSVENKTFCQGCFAKWHCAGDCHHKAVSAGGDESFRGSDRCHITRELLKDQIVQRIASSGGLVWRGRTQAQARDSSFGSLANEGPWRQ